MDTIQFSRTLCILIATRVVPLHIGRKHSTITGSNAVERRVVNRCKAFDKRNNSFLLGYFSANTLKIVLYISFGAGANPSLVLGDSSTHALTALSNKGVRD